MTMPSGKLQWGQTGVYDAIDDRLVITALSGGQAGVVRPATLIAGSGLNLELAGGWLAIAAAADGTNVVAGSHDSVTFTVPAGGSAARQDWLWCDVEPDTATWSLALLTSSEIIGRTGVLLATISVPANASAATALGLHPAGVSYGPRTVMLSPATDFIDVTGTQPTGSWTRIFRMPAGAPGAAVNYFLDLHLFGEISATEAVAVDLAYPGGIDRLSLVVRSSWSGDAGAARAGDASYTWITSGTDTWNSVGPMPATSGWRIQMRGQLRVHAITGLDTPPELTMSMNARTGTTVRVRKGCTMSLTPVTLQ